MRSYLCLIFFTLVLTSSYAHTLRSIKTCQKACTLNSTKAHRYAQIYFIKNEVNLPIFIDHKSKHLGAQAGWLSELMPGHWSVLAVSKKSFNLACFEVTQNQFIQKKCNKVISIWQYPNFQFTNDDGNYWLAEDKSYKQVIQIIKQRLKNN